jgi:hypothetical protein
VAIIVCISIVIIQDFFWIFWICFVRILNFWFWMINFVSIIVSISFVIIQDIYESPTVAEFLILHCFWKDFFISIVCICIIKIQVSIETPTSTEFLSKFISFESLILLSSYLHLCFNNSKLAMSPLNMLSFWNKSLLLEDWFWNHPVFMYAFIIQQCSWISSICGTNHCFWEIVFVNTIVCPVFSEFKILLNFLNLLCLWKKKQIFGSLIFSSSRFRSVFL